jgi:quinol monooxygenase YgiN
MMFGTVARSRLKDGVTADQLKQLFAGDDGPPGSLSVLVFQATSDPREIWIVGAFESRDTYQKNSDSPEQQARFERMSALMEGPPEWHDGEVLVARGEGRVLSGG